jgi:hypothetical protein
MSLPGQYSGSSAKLFAILLLVLFFPGCHASAQRGVPVRDINDVLRDHDKELMAIPGIVGVYVGALDDNKTACLRVMAIRKTSELERKIPKSLEGYKVILEESGEIRPLKKK